ncbi:MAG: shikimate dehydrogenase, partial [Clostridiales bacterium]|nr:shikimate dehydrogenase [Clostridiales bacterium]
MLTAKTKVLGVIGNPVEQSLSPVIHAEFSRFSGLDYTYNAFPVLSENIGAAISGAYALGIAGLNVTFPHKKAVMPYLCGIDETAAKIGAVNTLVRQDTGYKGYNTDYLGISAVLAEHGFLSPNRVVIIGAGGTAAAACAACAKIGAKEVVILNRTLANAEKLAVSAQKTYGLPVRAAALADCKNACGEIVIQTSTAGFKNENESPVNDTSFFGGVKFALDVIYDPFKTKFLHLAESADVQYSNGFGMLI